MRKNKDASEGKELKQDSTDNVTSQNMDNQIKPENESVEEVLMEEGEELGEETKVQDQPNFEAIASEWKDKYIRLSAEFDNYRKRTLKEKIDLTKYAGEDVLKSILPIVDDFERGMKHFDDAQDIAAVKEGVVLIYNKFTDFLKQKGLKEIDTTSGEFNTDFHEAITKIPVADKNQSGKIIDVIQKGYLLDERVIRYSKVVVGE